MAVALSSPLVGVVQEVPWWAIHRAYGGVYTKNAHFSPWILKGALTISSDATIHIFLQVNPTLSIYPTDMVR